MATLKAAYPQYYRGLSKDDLNAVVQLWSVLFAEDEYKDVVLAVHTLIVSRVDTFPPVIGEIKAALREVTHPDAVSSGEAWDMIMKCIRRGTVHAAEDWEQLPDAVRAAVSVDEIKRHAENESFNESVEKSLFLKRWAVLRDRRQAAQQMPPSLRSQVEARRAALETATPVQIESREGKPSATACEPLQAPKHEPVDIRAYLTGKGR